MYSVLCIHWGVRYNYFGEVEKERKKTREKEKMTWEQVTFYK